jgi:hypothetical protein
MPGERALIRTGLTFNPPLVVPSGKYFTVVARPFGTVASNTLVVTSSVGVNGYFE